MLNTKAKYTSVSSSGAPIESGPLSLLGGPAGLGSPTSAVWGSWCNLGQKDKNQPDSRTRFCIYLTALRAGGHWRTCPADLGVPNDGNRYLVIAAPAVVGDATDAAVAFAADVLAIVG